MNEFSYRSGPAVRTLLFSLLIGLPLLWIKERTDFVDLSRLTDLFIVALVGFLFQYSFLFNNRILLEAGTLRIQRRIGRNVEIRLRDIERLRVEESQLGFRGQREMIVFHGNDKTRFNIEDLRDEQAFVRRLESQLDGECRSLLDDPPEQDKSFLQKQLDRLHR